jgi:hypothetical protein
MPILEDRLSPIPYEYPELAYAEISSPPFRATMDKAIVELFTKFNIEIDNHNEDLWYLANVIYLIARLRIIEAWGELLKKLNSGYFVGQPSRRFFLPFPAPDLHFLLLKALLEFNPKSENMDVFWRFLYSQNGLYAHLCYRGLWVCDRALGVKHLPDLARIYNKQDDKSFDFYLEFGFYLREHFLYFIENYDYVFGIPISQLESPTTDLIISGVEHFMDGSHLVIMYDAFSEDLFPIFSIPPNTQVLDYPTSPIARVKCSSLIRSLLLSKYTQQNRFVPLIESLGKGDEQECDPENMVCFKLESAGSGKEIGHVNSTT